MSCLPEFDALLSLSKSTKVDPLYEDVLSLYLGTDPPGVDDLNEPVDSNPAAHQGLP